MRLEVYTNTGSGTFIPGLGADQPRDESPFVLAAPRELKSVQARRQGIDWVALGAAAFVYATAFAAWAYLAK